MIDLLDMHIYKVRTTTAFPMLSEKMKEDIIAFDEKLIKKLNKKLKRKL
jgi:hypothetical protein